MIRYRCPSQKVPDVDIQCDGGYGSCHFLDSFVRFVGWIRLLAVCWLVLTK
jgi:hypothetical protein